MGTQEHPTPFRPDIGTVWHERRRQYRRRTVKVLRVDSGFVYIQTLTLDDGRRPSRVVRTRVRRDLWLKTFDVEDEGSDAR
jgi:hypothetical protein